MYFWYPLRYKVHKELIRNLLEMVNMKQEGKSNFNICQDVLKSATLLHKHGFVKTQSCPSSRYKEVHAWAGFREKGVEGIVSHSNCVIWRHLPIRMDAMFEAIELPRRISHLAASLPHVNGDHFSLGMKLDSWLFEYPGIKNNSCFWIVATKLL